MVSINTILLHSSNHFSHTATEILSIPAGKALPIALHTQPSLWSFGTAARHRPAPPLDMCPPSSLTPLCLRWSQVARRSHFAWLVNRTRVPLLPRSLEVSWVDRLLRPYARTSPMHVQGSSALWLGKDMARVRRASPTCRAACGAASQPLGAFEPPLRLPIPAWLG